MSNLGFRVLKTTTLLCLTVGCCLLTNGCQQSEQQKSGRKILIGGTALLAAEGPVVQDSVILISGSKIQLVGVRKDAPITQNSERTDLTGKWIAPMPGGKLAADEPANLLILNSRNLNDVGRRMSNGEWQ